MTTPTNWPNPERPGFPMFPERDGWHWIMLLGEPIEVKWDAPSEAWRLGNYSYYTGPDWNLNWEYCSPIYTPAQINEMLAAERDRCAKVATEVSDTYYAYREEAKSDDERIYADELMCAAQECAEAIRNLGDAP